jgi:hypothetical protein
MRLGKHHREDSREKMASAARGRSVREKSSQWKGGRYRDPSNYWHVMVAMLPPATQILVRPMTGKNRDYILEHRAVMAEKLGRSLLPTELVHHADGDKANNLPGNLFLADRKDHSIRHREVEKELLLLRAEVARLREENLALRLRLGPSPTAGATCSSPPQ